MFHNQLHYMFFTLTDLRSSGILRHAKLKSIQQITRAIMSVVMHTDINDKLLVTFEHLTVTNNSRPTFITCFQHEEESC